MAVALVALAVFGGADSYRVKAVFDSAGQLVVGNQVRVGGGPVGTIDDIELSNSSDAVVTMEIDENLAPLHEGTTATIRATSLSGIANRYVSLSPGPNDANEIDDGGEIGADSTNAPVDIDAVFNALDTETREGLRNFIRGSGTQYDGKGKEAGESIKYFAPFLSSTTALTSELALDQGVLERFLRDGATTVSAIAERSAELEALVGNTNAAFRAIGDENVALGRALELLPGTLRKANTTFVNLRATLDDLDVLVEESKPATKRPRPVPPRAAAARGGGPAHGGRPAHPAQETRAGQRPDRPHGQPAPPGAAHLHRFPARHPGTRPLTARGRVRARLHAGPLRLAHQVRGGGGPLRRQRPLRARHAGVQPHQLRPRHLHAHRRPSRTAAATASRTGQKNRCPGGSIQPSPDGSAPWPFRGCDPTTTPSGP